MLTVMLCGAADIEGVREQFVEVGRLIGADPWHFTSGHILSENHPGGSFKANSRRSVQQADVCVFTVMRDYGDLTWTAEFQEAIGIGKPFLVLCLNSTFNEYLAYRQPGGQSSSATITTDPRLMERLRELESQRSVTIVTFDCQWPIVSARRRSVELPIGGHQFCPLMANGTARWVSWSVASPLCLGLLG